MTVTSERDRQAPLAVIVEDEALLALATENLLVAEGFRTIIAHTEAEAKALAGEPVVVAVVNLQLVGALAGQRVIRFLRNRLPRLPVVVVTGYNNRAPEANLRGLGWPTIRLHKPANYEQLACAVWDVLDHASQCEVAIKRRRREEPSKAE